MGIPVRCEERSLDDVCGESHPSSRKIYIDNAIPECTKVETFYHEFTHMALGLAGISVILDEKLEEAIAQCMGVAIAKLVSENADLPVLPENK